MIYWASPPYPSYPVLASLWPYLCSNHTGLRPGLPADLEYGTLLPYRYLLYISSGTLLPQKTAQRCSLTLSRSLLKSHFLSDAFYQIAWHTVGTQIFTDQMNDCSDEEAYCFILPNKF